MLVTHGHSMKRFLFMMLKKVIFIIYFAWFLTHDILYSKYCTDCNSCDFCKFDIIVDSQKVQEAINPYSGHQFSDYVLLGKDGKPIAVVEAKKTSVDAAIGREQAKQYCYNIQKKHGGELPFCFYTNGYEIHFWDLENYPPKKVYGFPTRDDLERYSYNLLNFFL